MRLFFADCSTCLKPKLSFFIYVDDLFNKVHELNVIFVVKTLSSIISL